MRALTRDSEPRERIRTARPECIEEAAGQNRPALAVHHACPPRVPHFVSRRPHLNGKHVVFGRVLEGLDALRDVEAVGSADGRTREPVVITDSGINNKL